jgi:hypothetical protein
LVQSTAPTPIGGSGTAGCTAPATAEDPNPFGRGLQQRWCGQMVDYGCSIFIFSG